VPASRRTSLLLLGILTIAAWLRLWTVGDGLPYHPGTDEPAIMGKVVGMLHTGDFNPHFFDYGGLVFYFHLGVAVLRFLYGAISGLWTTVDQVWEGDFYLWSRIATALLSVLTVYVVYRCGIRWGTRVALIAAATMAVQTQVVREAHFALTDTPLTFFVAVTLLMGLCAAEMGRLRWFLLAGAAAGLAAAIKYNGILAILIPLCVSIMVSSLRERTAAIGATIAGAVLGFVLAAPFSVLDLKNFLNGFAGLMQHYNTRANEPVATYLKYMGDWYTALNPKIDPYRITAWPIAILAFVGFLTVAIDLRRRHARAASLALLVFPLVYFWFITNQSALIYARYALPLTPALSVLLALGIVVARDEIVRVSKSPAAHTLLLPALLVVLLPGMFTAIASNWERRLVSPEEAAAEWVVAHVNPTDPIVIESHAFFLPPGFKADYENSLISKTVDDYRDAGVVYFVMSSNETNKYPTRAQFPAQVAAYDALLSATFQVERFSPGRGMQGGSTLTILKLKR